MVVMKHLSDLGIRVPQEVSVVGFDNLRFTEHLPVPLTTVDQPTQEMGRRAVELLLERIEVGKNRPSRREVFHPHLIIRDSCAIACTSEHLEAPSVLARG
jgi:LacI family transcriptional regulator